MEAHLYKDIGNGTLQCLACRHYCKIAPGGSGICAVRENVDGKLKLLVYGKAIAVAVDPIEKKPLFHFLPGSEIFSFGTIGCNFGCEFCQNWDISQVSKNIKTKLIRDKKQNLLEAEVTKLGYDLPPQEILAYCLKHKLGAIAYTYNEPEIFFEYTYDTAKLAHAQGIKNVYVSNGYASKEAVDLITPYLDAINIDLKGFTEEFYQKICKAKLAEVLDSIAYYHSKGIWLELTTLLVPGKNDSPAEIKKIAEFIAGIDKNIPWHVTAFTPRYKMKDVPETKDDKLFQAWETGRDAGLKYVYVGNTFDKTRESTYCPKCNELLVERDWGQVEIKNFQEGVCGNCGEKIPGIWK